jgi:hypothetical protein
MAYGALRLFLTSDLIKEHQQKKIEFDTPNRAYCSSPDALPFSERQIYLKIAGHVLTAALRPALFANYPNPTAAVLPTLTYNLSLLPRGEVLGNDVTPTDDFVELNYGCNHMAYVPL